VNDPNRSRWRLPLGGLCVALLLAPPELLPSDSPAPSRSPLSPGWNVLLSPPDRSPQPRPLPEGAPLRTVEKLTLLGPHEGHPFFLGPFETNGRWELAEGELRVAGGPNALLELPEADQFDLEGVFASERLGGMLFLIGWTADNSGYALYNPTMKTEASGSPWQLCRMRHGRFVPGTDQEVARQEWQGVRSIRLSVRDERLSLAIGPIRLIEDLPLPEYQPGKLLLGTYDTRYGPKNLRIRSLRIREIPPPDETSFPPAESP
jgi:hypothetical protein